MYRENELFLPDLLCDFIVRGEAGVVSGHWAPFVVCFCSCVHSTAICQCTVCVGVLLCMFGVY